MLRITINESGNAMQMKLAGRIAGPWAEELDRVWVETAPNLGSKKLSIDLSDVTFADEAGKKILGRIIAQTNAELITGTVWTQYLAQQVKGK